MSRSAYELTRLAFADVVCYRQILEELRGERKFRRMSYESSRVAISRYHRSECDTTILEDSIADHRTIEGDCATKEDTVQPKNNAEVLEFYLAHFASPFRPIAQEIPEEFDSYRYEVNGLTITGKPHLIVRNKQDKLKFLYLLTSKDWGDKEKGFFIGLLGEIIAKNFDDTLPRDVEGLDCRTGTKVIRSGLGKQNRQRLEFIAEDLKRRGLD